MPEYYLLFNAITDAINSLEALQQALMAAQIKAEDICISRED